MSFTGVCNVNDCFGCQDILPVRAKPDVPETDFGEWA